MANDNWMLKAVLSAVDRMSPTLKAVSQQARSTRKYLSDVGTSAGKLGTQFGLPVAAVTGLLAGFSVAAIKKAVVGFTEMSEEVKRGALQAGMSTDQYQRMKYVAEQAGVSVEALGAATGMLNRKIGDAATGKNKATLGLFQRLGIQVRDANGQLRSGVDLLPALAEAFKRNENPVIRARMGMALFGKQWQQVIPLLAEGGDEIQHNLERFGMLKGVISQEDLNSGKKLGDLFKDVSIILKGFQGAIARELVPVLTPLIEDFVRWGAANKKLIGVEVKRMVQDFARFVREVDWAKVVQGVMTLVGGLAQLLTFLAANKVLLIGLVALLNASTILAVVELGMAVGRLAVFLAGPLSTALTAVWALIVANPIGAAIVAIVALAAIIYTNWDGIVEYVSQSWDRIKAVFDQGFFSGLIQLWLEQWQMLGNAILGIVKSVIPSFLLPDAIKNFKLTFATERAAAATASTQPMTQAAGQAQTAGPNAAPLMSNPQGRPSLVNGPQGRVDGQVKIDINGLPPGSRVEQVAGGGTMPLNLDAGYSTFSLGMAM